MYDRILDWHLNERAIKLYGHANCIAMMGILPEMVFPQDPRPAWEQFNERYVFGGWNASLPGKWVLDQNDYLLFPGDPPLQPVAKAFLRDEAITIYPHAWVCIAQTDGSFSVARMD